MTEYLNKSSYFIYWRHLLRKIFSFLYTKVSSMYRRNVFVIEIEIHEIEILFKVNDKLLSKIYTSNVS